MNKSRLVSSPLVLVKIGVFGSGGVVVRAGGIF